MATALACIEPPTRLGTGLADEALEFISEAILVVDTGPPHLPVILANLAARRLLGATIREDSLYKYLVPRASLPLDALFGELARGAQPLRRLMAWHTTTGEQSFETAWQLVAGAQHEQLAMLRLLPEPPLMIGSGNAVARFVEGPDGDLTAWLEAEQLEMSRRERRRIGRDLHDGLGQELTGVALMLRGLARRLEHEAPQLLEPIDEIIAHANRAIESARTLARGLLPVIAEPEGLLAALRGLAERGRKLYDLDVQCRSEITPPIALDGSAANHLYRIAQEALSNAARHARASHVEILLRVVAGRFSLEIADDGIGLSSAPPSSSGLGLGILRERALQIGAHLEFVENFPSGTRVRVIGATQRRDC